LNARRRSAAPLVRKARPVWVCQKHVFCREQSYCRIHFKNNVLNTITSYWLASLQEVVGAETLNVVKRRIDTALGGGANGIKGDGEKAGLGS